jgi:rhodanese-related sulfurtransferase
LRIFLLFIALIAAITAAGCGKQVSFGEVGPMQMAEKLQQNDVLIIDVREEWEFKERRLPGAILMPLGELKKDYQELDPDAEIILVCRSGNRSGTAAAFLAGKGFKNVYNFTGGMLGWPGEVETGD